MSWVKDLFAAIDRKDTAAFVGFLTDDAVFRFGNQAPVHGREAIADAVGGFFASVDALNHRLEGCWDLDDVALCHGEVTYTRSDGSMVELPFADVFRKRDGKIEAYLIHMDITPLYESDG